jgi:hypothetical protein
MINMFGSFLRWPWSLPLQVYLLEGADAVMESQRRRPPPLVWVAVQVPTSAFTYSYLLRETEADTLSLDKRNRVG